jgi:hypothetical protein
MVDLIQLHDSHDFVVRVAQNKLLAYGGQLFRIRRQRDRQRKEHAVAEAHLVQHALIVSLPHEAVERGERTGGQEFEIAKIAHADLDGRQLGGAAQDFVPVLASHNKIDKFSPVWCYQFRFGHAVLP